jgi:hypothetical protein
MRAIPWFLIVSLSAACTAPLVGTTSREPSVCVLNAQPEILPVEEPIPGELNEAFELPDSPEWWGPAPMDDERERYRAALVSRLGGEQGVEPRALLERQRAIHAAMVGKEGAREVENIDPLLQGKVGALGPVSCLEWRLFQRQARRFPMIEHPTEFGAYVLRGHGRIRVYLSGADWVGGKLRQEVKGRVVADVARGFAPVAHLHNHPFLFDRKPGDRMWTTEDSVNDVAGAVAPSLTDVQAWRRLREHFGLQGAWVTNGLDTARYTAEDFDRLSAWP